MFSSKKAKIHTHSSEAHIKGMSGEFLVDLDEAYENGNVANTKNSDVVSAVNEIATKVARMKVKMYDGEGEEVKGNRVTGLLNEKANDFTNAYNFKFKVLADAIYNGNAFVEIVRREDKNGKPYVESLRLLNYNDVKVRALYEPGTTELNGVDYVYYNGVNDSSKNRVIPKEDMLHFKPFSFDRLVGLSLMDCLKDDLEIKNLTSRYAKEYLKKGGELGGYLRLDDGSNKKLDVETRNLIAKKWEEAGNNGYSVKVLDGVMEYTPSKRNPEDFKILMEGKPVASSFASLFGLPLHKMGVATSNMSLEQLNNEFINNTLGIYIEMLTSELNDKLFRTRGDYGTYIEFDATSIATYDTETILKIVDSGMKNGYISVDDARRKTGWEPIGEDYSRIPHMSLNFVRGDLKDKHQLYRSKGKEDYGRGGEDDE